MTNNNNMMITDNSDHTGSTQGRINTKDKNNNSHHIIIQGKIFLYIALLYSTCHIFLLSVPSTTSITTVFDCRPYFTTSTIRATTLSQRQQQLQLQQQQGDDDPQQHHHQQQDVIDGIFEALKDTYRDILTKAPTGRMTKKSTSKTGEKISNSKYPPPKVLCGNHKCFFPILSSSFKNNNNQMSTTSMDEVEQVAYVITKSYLGTSKYASMPNDTYMYNATMQNAYWLSQLLHYQYPEISTFVFDDVDPPLIIDNPTWEQAMVLNLLTLEEQKYNQQVDSAGTDIDYYYYQPHLPLVLQQTNILPFPTIRLKGCFDEKTAKEDLFRNHANWNKTMDFIYHHVLVDHQKEHHNHEDQQQHQQLTREQQEDRLDKFIENLRYRYHIISNMTRPDFVINDTTTTNNTNDDDDDDDDYMKTIMAKMTSATTKRYGKRRLRNPFACLLYSIQFLVDAQGGVYHMDLDRCFEDDGTLKYNAHSFFTNKLREPCLQNYQNFFTLIHRDVLETLRTTTATATAVQDG